jgi:hypothetical protein
VDNVYNVHQETEARAQEQQRVTEAEEILLLNNMNIDLDNETNLITMKLIKIKSLISLKYFVF